MPHVRLACYRGNGRQTDMNVSTCSQQSSIINTTNEASESAINAQLNVILNIAPKGMTGLDNVDRMLRLTRITCPLFPATTSRLEKVVSEYSTNRCFCRYFASSISVVPGRIASDNGIESSFNVYEQLSI